MTTPDITEDRIKRVTHAYRVLWPYLGEQRGDPGLLVALAGLTDELLRMSATNPRLVRMLACDEIGREIGDEHSDHHNTRTIVSELLAIPEMASGD